MWGTHVFRTHARTHIKKKKKKEEEEEKKKKKEEEEEEEEEEKKKEEEEEDEDDEEEDEKEEEEEEEENQPQNKQTTKHYILQRIIYYHGHRASVSGEDITLREVSMTLLEEWDFYSIVPDSASREEVGNPHASRPSAGAFRQSN